MVGLYCETKKSPSPKRKNIITKTIESFG